MGQQSLGGCTKLHEINQLLNFFLVSWRIAEIGHGSLATPSAVNGTPNYSWFVQKQVKSTTLLMFYAQYFHVMCSLSQV